ncbi:Transcriptional activator spt7 [Pichia californica]|uniref:non-specific serine/threonine protein kinase n=1 Tax=Pichia californica TaxID=460514 RepID=A0A9P6WMZ5_9ASCO|nr:Transcriptional activator spt7 [[Candida] californica]
MSMKDLSNIVINNKYQLKKRIGSGSYGIVYSAIHLYSGISYAVKIILKNNSANTSNNKQLLVELEKSLIYQSLLNNGCLEANLLNLDLIEKYGTDCKFLREISLQLKVHKHPNILSIYKVYDFQNAIFVVMDYFPEGDLFTTIVDKQRYKDDPFLIKSVFIQLIDAINYCHSKSVYHCDLKPENVLVADNGIKLILADFGLALQEKFINSNISCGSSYYMSPERIQNFSQAFNTIESHSIHIERLMNPNNDLNNDYHSHGNVKFPTSAGDVWSLAIILINLISIRNPWLKASLHDTTFKAFVQNPKILMKILPISLEVFNIIIKYLNLNPWERGSLFEFRLDILKCSKLTESGPLSIDSTIHSMDIITTESQISIMNSQNYANLSNYEVCPIPIDHVKLDKIRSGELEDLDQMEVQNDYIPKSTKDNSKDVLNGGVNDNKFNKVSQKECNSCVNCGFGYDNTNHAICHENSNSLLSPSLSSSSSSSISSQKTSANPNSSIINNRKNYNVNKIDNYNINNNNTKPIYSGTSNLNNINNSHHDEQKHENILKKFFKYGPGGYNPNNFTTSARGPLSGKNHRHYLSPFKNSQDTKQLQHQHGQQQQQQQQKQQQYYQQLQHQQQKQQQVRIEQQQIQLQQQLQSQQQQQEKQKQQYLQQQAQQSGFNSQSVSHYLDSPSPNHQSPDSSISTEQQKIQQQQLLIQQQRQLQQQHQLQQQQLQQQQLQQQQLEQQQQLQQQQLEQQQIQQQKQQHIPIKDATKSVPDYKSIFPMPGMGHANKAAISSQQRKKFVTKRRQRRPTSKNVNNINTNDNKNDNSANTYNSNDSNYSGIEYNNDSIEAQKHDSFDNINNNEIQNNIQNIDKNTTTFDKDCLPYNNTNDGMISINQESTNDSSYSTAESEIESESGTGTRKGNGRASGSDIGTDNTGDNITIADINPHFNTQYHNNGINKLSQTLSTMSIMSNGSEPEEIKQFDGEDNESMDEKM